MRARRQQVVHVPRVRRDYTRSALAGPAYLVARVWRARLPGQAADRIRSGGCEAVMPRGGFQALAAGREIPPEEWVELKRVGP